MLSPSDCLHTLPARLREAFPTSAAVSLYLVGGFVRDVLLGRPTHDVDLAVAGSPASVARTLAGRVGGAVVPLDPERGIYRVVLREPLDGIPVVDLTRLRGPTIEADLAARDFTINAIAVRLDGAASAFIDPTGGIGDLEARRVRMVSSQAFRDDPVRLLRAVRFAVQLDFSLDDETASLTRRDAALLCRTAAERQRDELAQILRTDDAMRGASLLLELGLLYVLLPDLEATAGCTQPKEHYYDVLEHSLHTLGALDSMLRRSPPVGASPRAASLRASPSNASPSNASDEARAAWMWRVLWERLGPIDEVRVRLDEVMTEDRPRRIALKLAGLLHDVSKPETKTVDPRTGRTRFYGHDDLGSRRTAALARGLRFSTREAAYMELLVREHLRPGMLAAPGEVPTRRALYRFSRDLDGAAPELLLLNLADHAAARGPELTEMEWRRHVDFVAWVLRMLYVEARIIRPPKLLTGNDLMRELDLRPGPAIGKLLDAVKEAQAAGEVETAAEALALARRTLAALYLGDQGS